jgi:hypothetical protein
MPRRDFRKRLRRRLIRPHQFSPCNGIPGQEANAFTAKVLPVIASAIQKMVESIRGRQIGDARAIQSRNIFRNSSLRFRLQ